MGDIRTVIAVVGEDDRYTPIREAAIERALEDRATLILYDIDAAESLLESPVPTHWSAEGTEEELGDRLGPAELEASGRETIARQVASARARGVDAWGWLPTTASRDALVEFASRQPAARLYAPRDDPDLDLDDLPEAELVPAEPTGDRG